MRPRRREQIAWAAGVAAVAVVLVLLAILQYRWSEELNQAASDRMRAGLQSSMMGMRDELSRELASVAYAIRPPANDSAAATEVIALRFAAWKRGAPHPELVRDVFVFEPAGSKLLRLNVTGEFESTAWPEPLAAVAQPLSEFAAGIKSLRNSDVIRRRFPMNAEPGRPVPEPPAFIYEPATTLVVPMVSQRAGEKETPDVSWLVVQLSEDQVRKQILPDLARRYFSGREGLEYDVGVLTRAKQGTVLYSTGPENWTDEKFNPDGKLNLFGPPVRFAGQEHVAGSMRSGEAPGGQAGRFSENRMFFRLGGGMLRVEPLPGTGSANAWELLVKHKRGSLEAALRSVRRRHLAISFGVLLVLAVTISMTLLATRRAQKLAALQMQFVAGVSHELRTPLAVIASAADNIADDIITDRSKLVKYGKVIRNHARGLTHLVDEILLFAATRNGGLTLNSVAMAPAEIISAVVSDCAEQFRNAGVTLEQDIEKDLPTVHVDRTAVVHCLQNLVTNAVKYGGDARWVGISAKKAKTEEGTEVQIAVADRGIGMSEREIKQAFEPFYRSPAVIAAQIHGSGLGLALARSIAESMGGQVTVTSEPGKGSQFVLHLPCNESSSASLQSTSRVTDESSVPMTKP